MGAQQIPNISDFPNFVKILPVAELNILAKPLFFA
jgi:hypothetical protein